MRKKTLIHVAIVASFPVILLMIQLLSNSINAEPHVVVGDINCGKGLNNTKMIRDTGMPFIGLGDYFYRDNQKCIEKLSDVLKSIYIRYGIVGNHEFYTQIFSKAYNDVFGRSSKSYFSTVIDDVLYIGTNVYVNFESNSKQYDRIEQWLNNTKSDKIAVLVHTPLFAPVGAKEGGGHEPNSKFKKIYGPLFEKYEVDLVLSGDDHIYGYYDRTSGFDQVICGHGGHGGDTINQERLEPFQFARALPNKMGGYCVIDFVTDNEINVTFYDQNNLLLHQAQLTH